MRKLQLAFLVLLSNLFLNTPSRGQSINTNQGKDFWFGYTLTSDGVNAAYVVYMNTFKTTSGTISIPGAAWSQTFTVVAGVSTRIVLPSVDVVVASFNAPTSQAVHVVADSNIFVFAAIENSARCDNTCVLPVPLLGNQYYIMDYDLCQSFSEFMIAAQDCKDSVEIIPTHSITVGGNHLGGVPYTEVLQPGQVFVVQCDSDLTGSMVMSLNHAETGVFAGANWNCVYCSGTSNPFYEEMLPINTWGTDYVFLPTWQAQDQCRVLSEQNGTVVTFHTGLGLNIQTLNAGQFYDTTVLYATPVYISATNPISVGRYMRTDACNNYYVNNPGGIGDPAEVILNSNSQMYLDSIAFYVSHTPDIDSTYIGIVTRTADRNAIYLDGVDVGALFNVLGPNPTYAYASFNVLQGSHKITSTGQGFLAYSCGLGQIDATACDAGVFLQEININVTSTVPSSCGASDATATAFPTGISPFKYLWSNGQTAQTATGLKAGIYSVTVSDSDCVPHKATATVNITSKVGYTASVVDTNPSCRARGSSMANPSGGTSPYTYSWSNGATSQKDTGLIPGTYTCVITDHVGCKYFFTTTISNTPPPTLGFFPSHDSICQGNTTVLHVYGVNANKYSWTPNKGLSCYNCDEPTAGPNSTTTYTVSGIDSDGCSASASITIFIYPSPKPIITGKDSICPGYPDTLNVKGASTYSWSNAATTTTIIVSPANMETFTVTGSDADQCPSHDTTFTISVIPPAFAKINPLSDSLCKGDSVQLIASGGLSYKWDNGKTTAGIWVLPDTTLVYTVHAFSGACSDSTSATVYVRPRATVSLYALHDSICPHDTTTLIAKGAGGQLTYKWNTGATTSSIQVNDTTNTTYTATVYGKCNTAQNSIGVTVIPLPKPLITGDSQRCHGNKDTLIVSGGTSYKWNNGQTGSTYITGKINADSIVYVNVKNSIGCAVKDSFEINIKAPPVDSVTPPNLACVGTSVMIKATGKGNGPFTYRWSPGGQTSDSIMVIDTTSTYTVSISNGCVTIKTIAVTPDNPFMLACCNTVIFKGDDTTIVVNGTGIVKYKWRDSNEVVCLNPPCDSVKVTPTVTTTYTVIGTDALGCETEQIVTIVVDLPCLDFSVPNVFTPNYAGPYGTDNIFYINAPNVVLWSIVIYDRWGKEMFSSTNPLQHWDGNTEGGSKAPDGVYYYIITGSCLNKTYKKEGFVQLIR